MNLDGPAPGRHRPIRVKRRLRLLPAAALALLGALAGAPSSAPGVNNESHEKPRPQQLGILTPEEFPLVAKGVRLLYDGYYIEAAKEFDRLRSLLPESPAGELGDVLPHAVRLREDPKNREIQKALESGLAAVEKKASALLQRNPGDLRGLFYIGAAHFLRAQAHRHRGSYLTFVRELRAARKYLGRVVEQRADAWEAYVGLGGYNYFIDTLPAFAKFVRWVLFLPGGSRENGLRQLQLARERSVLLGPLAQTILLVAYSAYEKRPERAEAMALSLRRDFPNNPWFHLNLGYLYLSSPRRIERAVQSFREVLERAQSGHPNYVREISDRARLGLVVAYSRLGKGTELRRAAAKLLERPPVRPKYLVPLTRLLLGEQLARNGKVQQAKSRFALVKKVRDWGHFDWRVRQLGFESGKVIRRRASTALKNLPDALD